MDFLFCSIDLYFCLCQYHTVLMTIVFWYSLKWGRLIPPVPLFFLNIALAIWVFFFFCIYIQIVKLFVLVLWKIPLVASWGLHWIHRLLWVVYSFSLYWFFWSMNMVYLSIYLCHLWFLSSVVSSFLCMGLLFLYVNFIP